MRTLNKNNLVARSLSLPKGLATAAVSISLFLAACGDDNKNAGGTVEDQEVIAIADKTISGVSQKGPFVNGSSVTVQELDGETLAQTGNSYEGKIKNDMGEFSVKVTKLASQYALLKANGFYRNEVTGEKSKSQVTLYALTDLSNRDEVNVNLLTHLEYERSLYLSADDSVTVAAAKKQAEHEVLASFGIDGDFKSAEDLNIFGEDEGAAALLAISVLMQGDLNEADFSERLADYAADMETDGKWDDSKTATEIADWAAAKSLGQSLSYIREKITNWGLSADVPAFEKYVDNFWWQNYGLGTCNKKREGEVKKNENTLSRNYSTYFICESGAWRVAYDTEYDTYQQKCDEDGKIVFGNVNKDYAYDCDVQRWRHASNVEAALGGCVEKRFDEVAETAGIHYICQNREWRTATNIEKDTYKWLETVKKAKDGDVRYGDVIKTNCYVFEDKAWRSGNATDCSLGLRGCTALRQDTVGLGSDNVWYKCSSKQWKQASEFEKDTAAWGAGKFDGEIRSGQINTSVYYIYETDKSAWRRATDLEKDTYDYKKNKDWAAGQDGDSKYGSVNTKNCYVFEDKTWRSGNETDCTLRLRGCTALRQDTVGKGTDKMWHICDAKSWRDATTYEKDTFGWKDSTDGAIKKGNVTDTVYVFDKTAWRVTSNVEAKLGGCVSAIADSVGRVGSTYYICKSNKWVEASAIEYDTYRWATGKDGDSKPGSVNTNNCYVYENSVWRSGNTADCSLGLRGCTTLRQDTVGKGSDKVWHICDAKSWRNATTYEKDTFDWKDSTDGAIKKGNVTDTVYVFDKTAWRVTSNVEAKLGGCVSAIADSVGKVGSTYYICKSNKWVEASALEYDTYRWVAGKDGDSKTGSVDAKNCYVYEDNVWRSGNASDCSLELRGCTALRQDTVGMGRDDAWYKCDSRTWRTATNIEKDTATWGVGEFDGEVRAGQINKTVYYIYETIKKTWRNATALEYDTYQEICSEDGKMFYGNVNTRTKYVCDNGMFRAAYELEIAADSACTSYNRNEYYVLPRVYNDRNYSYYKCAEYGWSFTTEKLNQGTMTDLRDGHIYKTIGVKTQMWMAENLNYADSVNYPSMLGRNWCIDDADSCALFGRYYTWSAVIDSIYWSKQAIICGYADDPEDLQCNLPGKVQGICPDGWHVPTFSEWKTLLSATGNSYKTLQAKGYSEWKKATDEFGFSALPAGSCTNGYISGDVGAGVNFWSATDEFCDKAFWLNLGPTSTTLNWTWKWTGFSVRCIKDEE